MSHVTTTNPTPPPTPPVQTSAPAPKPESEPSQPTANDTNEAGKDTAREATEAENKLREELQKPKDQQDPEKIKNLKETIDKDDQRSSSLIDALKDGLKPEDEQQKKEAEEAKKAETEKQQKGRFGVGQVGRGVARYQEAGRRPETVQGRPAGQRAGNSTRGSVSPGRRSAGSTRRAVDAGQQVEVGRPTRRSTRPWAFRSVPSGWSRRPKAGTRRPRCWPKPPTPRP